MKNLFFKTFLWVQYFEIAIFLLLINPFLYFGIFTLLADKNGGIFLSIVLADLISFSVIYADYLSVCATRNILANKTVNIREKTGLITNAVIISAFVAMLPFLFKELVL